MGCANSGAGDTNNSLSRSVIGGGGDLEVEYFCDFYGRGDSLRFLLHKAGAKHNYIGHTQEEWGAIKSEGK